MYINNPIRLLKIWIKMYRIISVLDGREVGLEDILNREMDVLFFGEVHNVPWIIDLERMLVEELYGRGSLKFVGLEWFNYRMDEMVGNWLKDKISWDEFKEEYEKGPEGFPLDSYRPVLEAIKRVGVPIIGVMPPRDEVKHISRYGLDGVDKIVDSPISKDELKLDFRGYREILYSMFPKEGPMARLDPEKIFIAQAYKDEVISYRVFEGYKRYGPGLVITGFAHSEIYGSASTRLKNRGLKNYIVFSSRNSKWNDVKDWFDRNRDVLETDYIAIIDQ